MAKPAKAILLAEDADDDAFFLKRVLQKALLCNPIFFVRDGAEAIAYLNGDCPFNDREQYPLPAFLFLDLKMPRVHGQGVLHWLKSHPPLGRMRVFVVSHHDDKKTFDEVYALGAESFLTKPVRLAEVINLIRQFPGDWQLEAG